MLVDSGWRLRFAGFRQPGFVAWVCVLCCVVLHVGFALGLALCWCVWLVLVGLVVGWCLRITGFDLVLYLVFGFGLLHVNAVMDACYFR